MLKDINKLIKKTLDNHGRGITIGSIIKFTILAIAAMFAISILLAMFKWTFGISSQQGRSDMGIGEIFSKPGLVADYMDDMVTNSVGGYGGGVAEEMQVRGKMVAPSMALDIMPIPPIEPASKNAEDYETREYSATFEESNINKTCKEFEGLKPLDYIVFESANKSDTYCSYRFKVEVEHEQEVIALIESLDPKDFNANTFTIERSITSSANEIEILEKKLEMLDSLLESAQAKYAALRDTGNTTALVQAINNEINLIERITNQKLNVQAQIDRLANSKGRQEERIDYSQFNITVNERKVVDFASIGESWRYALERFVAEVSTAMQDLTIGLLMFAFKLIKFVLYVSVAVVALTVAARLLWRLVRKVWKS